jgi:hypothetical protein
VRPCLRASPPRLAVLFWVSLCHLGSRDGSFNDHATFSFVNRNLPVPDFTTVVGRTDGNHGGAPMSVLRVSTKVRSTPAGYQRARAFAGGVGWGERGGACAARSLVLKCARACVAVSRVCLRCGPTLPRCPGRGAVVRV